MKKNRKGIGLFQSLLIFGIASVALILETQFLIPFLSEQTGREPIIFWFIVASLGLFLPMLMLSGFILRSEGIKIDKQAWKDRLRFKKMNSTDWLWGICAVIAIGISSFIIMRLLELLTGKVENHTTFMAFETLTPDRHWILLMWLPYWIMNIMGEEILWRGVLLPKQEIVFGKNASLINGLLWGMFHIAFGWHLLLTLIPILLIQPFVVQLRKNTWIGVIIHAVINGPSFIAISFGWL